MNKKQMDRLIIIFVILAIISLFYPPIDNFLEDTFSAKENVLVERVIDGDTIDTGIGSIRFLGINTPERGELYYNEAKVFLETEILNKTVELEFARERYDKYNRTLAYVFYENRNINVDLVENGFANYYFYDGRDKYSNELEDAWDKCINNKINLCEPSSNICKSCISINKNYLINNCGFTCDIKNWTIKGEGREIFTFNQTLAQGQQEGFELDLTDSGGSLFLRDSDGKLVLWKRN